MWQCRALSKEAPKILEVPTYKSHRGRYAPGNPQTQAALGLCSPQLDWRFRVENVSGWNPDGLWTWD